MPTWPKMASLALLLAVAAGSVLYWMRFQTAHSIYPISGGFVQIEENKLYVQDQGTGRTVLFLHGFPYNSGTFAGLIGKPWPGYRFIAFDFPGMGFSSKHSRKNLNPEQLALTAKLVLDYLGIQNVDLVGHDLGGGVAMVFCASFPQSVRKLVLLAPDSSAGDASAVMNGLWRVPVAGEAWAALRLDRGFIRDMLEVSWAPQSADWYRDVERYYLPLDTANGRRGFLKIHRGRSHFDYLRYEERLKTDCLVLWGQADAVVPPERANRLLQSLGQSRLEIIPNAGHMLPDEAPDEVGKRIKEFLEKNNP